MIKLMQTIWIPNEQAKHELDPRKKTTKSIAETMLRNIASKVPPLLFGVAMSKKVLC
jgi:hypothetical protein